MSDNAIVKIRRFDPTAEQEPHYETYEVPPEAWNGLKVTDALRYIYENLDHSLSFREPCDQRMCGGCVVSVNNKTVMACDALAEKEMLIEPAANHKVLKDLIVELSREEGGGGDTI